MIRKFIATGLFVGLAAIAPGCGVATAEAETFPVVHVEPVALQVPDPIETAVALGGGALGGAAIGGVVGAGVGAVLCLPALVPTVGLACAVTIPAGAAVGIIVGTGLGYGTGAAIAVTK
jgi:hypothetical protein